MAVNPTSGSVAGMKARHLVALWGITALFAGLIGRDVGAKPQPENDSRWAQYTRTCSPFKLYGFSASSTDAEALIDNQSAEVLLNWGTQIEVSCSGASGARALVCFHMMPDVGYSAAYALKFNPDFGSSGDCGDGCGEYDDSSGASGITDHAACFLVADGQTKYRRISPALFYGSGGINAPTTRKGRCTTVGTGGVLGGACASSTDCGSTGSPVCTTDRIGPLGPYTAIRVSNTSLTCQVEICI